MFESIWVSYVTQIVLKENWEFSTPYGCKKHVTLKHSTVSVGIFFDMFKDLKTSNLDLKAHH